MVCTDHAVDHLIVIFVSRQTLFGKVADGMGKYPDTEDTCASLAHKHVDEMTSHGILDTITDRDIAVNRFISVPRDLSSLWLSLFTFHSSRYPSTCPALMNT